MTSDPAARLKGSALLLAVLIAFPTAGTAGESTHAPKPAAVKKTRGEAQTVSTSSSRKETVPVEKSSSAECHLWNCFKARVHRFTDHVEAKLEMAICAPAEPRPYLQDVAAPGVRLARPEPAFRQPPLLPKIVVTAPEQPAPAGQPGQFTDPLAPDAAPAQKEMNNHSLQDEAVDFFRDSGNTPSTSKGLGETFDPNFPVPPPVAPPSSANYHRE